MPSELGDTHETLRTIRENIGLAQQFVEGLDVARFQKDTRTLYAVTRCLEIISEASRRLPDDLKTEHPQISWGKIAGAGNVYRHDYESLSAQVIWNTVHSLSDLLSFVEEELSKGT